MRPRAQAMAGTACAVTHAAVRAPDGTRHLVLEVACPNHPRPVPIRVCMGCRGYLELALEASQRPTLLCTPAIGDGAQHARASTADSAGDIMRPGLLLDATASLATVEHLFHGKQQPQALVVDHASRVVGVLNASDLEALRATGELPDGEPARDPDTTVTARDLTRPLLVWVTPKTPVRHISFIMAQTQQHRVAVIGPHGAVGEVTRDDVERWMSQLSTASTLDLEPPPPSHAG